MTILVAYDPKTRDQAPVRFGVAAARFATAPLVVVSVHAGPRSRSARQSAELARLQADLARHAGIEQVRMHTMQASTAADVARELQRAAEEEHADLVVVGASRRGAIGRVAPGTTAQQMINGCRRPVVVVPHGHHPSPRLSTIGVAFAPTTEGRQALRVAAAIARIAGARLRVLSAMKPGIGADASAGPTKEVAERRRAVLEATVGAAVDDLGAGLRAEHEIFVDDAGAALLEVSAHLDLLVMGSRGRGPVLGVLLGSVSRRVTAEADCPVLVVPRTSAAVPAVRPGDDARDARSVSSWPQKDVRPKLAGGFAGPVPPNARVGKFAGAPRRRSQGIGRFADNPGRRRQGSFGDIDLNLIARHERSGDRRQA